LGRERERRGLKKPGRSRGGGKSGRMVLVRGGGGWIEKGERKQGGCDDRGPDHDGVGRGGTFTLLLRSLISEKLRVGDFRRKGPTVGDLLALGLEWVRIKAAGSRIEVLSGGMEELVLGRGDRTETRGDLTKGEGGKLLTWTLHRELSCLTPSRVKKKEKQSQPPAMKKRKGVQGAKIFAMRM